MRFGKHSDRFSVKLGLSDFISLFSIHIFLFQKINQEPVVDHCVNVTKNFLKICLKLSGIGNLSTTKIGVVLITKLFAVPMQTTPGEFFRFGV